MKVKRTSTDDGKIRKIDVDRYFNGDFGCEIERHYECNDHSGKCWLTWTVYHSNPDDPAKGHIPWPERREITRNDFDSWWNAPDDSF